MPLLLFVRVRIVVDYRPALRERSGVGEYIHHLIDMLAAGPGRHDDIVLFSSSLRHALGETPIPGTHVRNLRIPVRILNWLWHRFSWPPIELLASGRVDVAHSPHPLLMPAKAAAQVITIHDLDFLTHPERTRGEVHRDYPRLVRHHAHLADHIVVNSAHTAGEVHQRLEVPRRCITVCRPGAPAWPARKSTPEHGHILFVGTLEPRKNVPGLLDAYERVLSAHPDAPDLVIAGRATAAASAWLRRVSAPPLQGKVRHLGYVPDATRRELYEGARLLVLPSFHEGFGLPVLEAMTVGVPVVASDRGAISEVLGDAGVLVDPDDPDNIANAMVSILYDRKREAQASARGIRRSLTFDWRASAEALHAAYRQAVAFKRERQRVFARRR